MIDTPIMTDYAWASTIYGVYGYRWMIGYSAHKMKFSSVPEIEDYLIGGLLAILAFPFWPFVSIFERIGKTNGRNALDIAFPDPLHKKSLFQRRRDRLELKLKERDTRIKELEREAGIC